MTINQYKEETIFMFEFHEPYDYEERKKFVWDHLLFDLMPEDNFTFTMRGGAYMFTTANQESILTLKARIDTLHDELKGNVVIMNRKLPDLM
jgi:hypothetical protein